MDVLPGTRLLSSALLQAYRLPCAKPFRHTYKGLVRVRHRCRSKALLYVFSPSPLQMRWILLYTEGWPLRVLWHDARRSFHVLPLAPPCMTSPFYSRRSFSFPCGERIKAAPLSPLQTRVVRLSLRHLVEDGAHPSTP